MGNAWVLRSGARRVLAQLRMQRYSLFVEKCDFSNLLEHGDHAFRFWKNTFASEAWRLLQLVFAGRPCVHMIRQ